MRLFAWPVRVYYEDTDAGALGVTQLQLRRGHNGLDQLHHAICRADNQAFPRRRMAFRVAEEIKTPDRQHYTDKAQW